MSLNSSNVWLNVISILPIAKYSSKTKITVIRTTPMKNRYYNEQRWNIKTVIAIQTSPKNCVHPDRIVTHWYQPASSSLAKLTPLVADSMSRSMQSCPAERRRGSLIAHTMQCKALFKALVCRSEVACQDATNNTRGHAARADQEPPSASLALIMTRGDKRYASPN